MHVVKKSARRSAVAVAATAVGLVVLAVPGWAHVEAELDDVSASGLAEITFGFHHGCGGAATTELRIQIPEGVSDISPEPAEGFTTDVSATEFGWSGGSVPDGEEATFIVRAQLSGQAGDVIAFPTIQQCGDQDLVWNGPPGGSTEDETEQPSPSITLPATYAAPDPVAGSSPGSTAPTGLVTTTTLSDTATPETAESNTTGLIVFIVIVVVVLGGAIYLYLSNRRPRPPAAPIDETGPSETGPDDPTGGSPKNRSPH